jgi:hypothetical protein
VTEEERKALRSQARDWLQAELAGWRADQAAGGDRAKAARDHLALAREDGDFDGVHSEAALKALPVDEAASWRTLWREIQAVLEAKEQPR